ncbi:hypothetical protein ES705_03139 [subsurface metagenome]
MTTTQEVEDFEQIIERIVFDEGELDELKISIRNFSKGTITPKLLKQNLLRCRGRIVKDISNFLSFCVERARDSGQAPVSENFTGLNQSDLANDQLHQEIAERNELLEVVAKKISALMLKAKKDIPVVNKSLCMEDVIKIELKRVFLAIKIDEWLDMCGYDDYKFYIKLYNKLQALYRQKFGDEREKPKNAKEEHEIMAGKIVKLNFPEEVTTELIRYIAIRNNATHDDWDLTPSDIEIAHNVFVRLLIYLIASSLNVQLLAENRKAFYDYLHQYFSNKLENNSKFLERIKENLNSLFNNFR